MDAKQFEAMLSDAETRLRRLRMLYDQWFMGLERLEPAVARKEFDDSMTRLRKEQVNNTALRFRMQQLVQRQTTFATYWRRIARQIEEGTYQRDVLRARRQRGAGQGRERSSGEDAELSYDVDIDMDAELEAALDEVNRAAETVASAAKPAPGTLAAAQQAPGVAVFGVPTVDTPVAAGAALPTQRAAPPLASARQPNAAPAPAGRVPGPKALSPFALPTKPAAGGGDKPALDPARVAAKPPAPAGGPAKLPPPTAAGAVPGSAALAAVRALKPPGSAAAAGAFGTAVAPAKPAAAVAGAAGEAGALGNSGTVAKPAATSATAAAKPAAPKPTVPQPSAAAARPAPAKPQVAPAPAAKAPAAVGGGPLSSDDVQRIYSQYVAARKQNAERTDNVKLDNIEKTLRGMLPQLEKKHAGKKIDFEVVVKDGRVALKPVAK